MKNLCRWVLGAGLLITSLSEVYAQDFNRFDSAPTRRKRPPRPTAKPDQAVNERAPRPNRFDNSPKRDSFGRKTNLGGIKDVPKNKAYVNLNPETAFGPEVVESFHYI